MTKSTLLSIGLLLKDGWSAIELKLERLYYNSVYMSTVLPEDKIVMAQTSTVVKDFDAWNTEKKKVHTINNPPFFHEREIWYCALGVNVGFEQDGKGKDFLRPVIIARKFNKAVFFGIPLTHTEKDKPFYYTFSFGKRGKSTAVLSQMRLIDVKRLNHKLGEISERDFVLLMQKLKALLP